MKMETFKIITWYIKYWYVIAILWIGYAATTLFLPLLGFTLFGKNNQYNPIMIPVHILKYFSTDQTIGNIVYEIIFFPVFIGSYISQDLLKMGEGGIIGVPIFVILSFFLTCYITKRLLEKIKTV